MVWQGDGRALSQIRDVYKRQHMGMRKLREGDFPIGNGYYMNDYIMGLEI